MDWKRWEGRDIDGRLHLRQHLGGSAHSAVYLTESGDGAPRKAAIKLMPADPPRAEAWLRQRQRAARLAHPGLLAIYQTGRTALDGTQLIYAVGELADEDLSQVLPGRALTIEEAREMLIAVVETLSYVHAAGFVHGNLGPSNVMAAGDRIKISSDGLLPLGESDSGFRSASRQDAPEGRGALTPASDVWSLGMLLVKSLTQLAPVWERDAGGDPEVPATLPAPFFDLARRCLRVDPRRRCTLAEVARTLQPGAGQPAPATAKRRPVLIWTSVALAAAIVAGAMLTRSGPGNSTPSAETPAAKPAVPVNAAPAKTAAKTGEILPKGEVKTSATAEAVPKPSAFGPNPRPAAATPANTAPANAAPGAASANAATSAAPQQASAPAAPSARPAAPATDRPLPDVPREYYSTIHGSFTVAVRVHVDASGAVTSAELASAHVSPYFDRVSVETARRWKFPPQTAAGGSAATRIVRFEYRPSGCTVSAD